MGAEYGLEVERRKGKDGGSHTFFLVCFLFVQFQLCNYYLVFDF